MQNQNQFQVHVPQTQLSVPEKNVLYVSDLPQNITETDLVMFFDDYKDKILVVNISTNSKFNDYTKPNSSKIIFKDPVAANEARKALNMKKIKGRTIRVMWDERDDRLNINSQPIYSLKTFHLM